MPVFPVHCVDRDAEYIQGVEAPDRHSASARAIALGHIVSTEPPPPAPFPKSSPEQLAEADREVLMNIEAHLAAINTRVSRTWILKFPMLTIALGIIITPFVWAAIVLFVLLVTGTSMHIFGVDVPSRPKAVTR